jgi:Zn-dependent M28 family amino/carboxypeptidase
MCKNYEQTFFPATVIFVAVSGEEQGLLGANYMAEKARKKLGY